jgi:hypothetical protein
MTQEEVFLDFHIKRDKTWVDNRAEQAHVSSSVTLQIKFIYDLSYNNRTEK